MHSHQFYQVSVSLFYVSQDSGKVERFKCDVGCARSCFTVSHPHFCLLVFGLISSKDVIIPISPAPISFGIGGCWYWSILVLVGISIGIGIGGYWYWWVLVLVLVLVLVGISIGIGIGIGGY